MGIPGFLEGKGTLRVILWSQKIEMNIFQRCNSSGKATFIGRYVPSSIGSSGYKD
jgi:hypothetical protein